MEDLLHPGVGEFWSMITFPKNELYAIILNCKDQEYECLLILHEQGVIGVIPNVPRPWFDQYVVTLEKEKVEYAKLLAQNIMSENVLCEVKNSENVIVASLCWFCLSAKPIYIAREKKPFFRSLFPRKT